MDADVPAAGPVGQRLRARAGPERDRPVERAPEAREPVAHDELRRAASARPAPRPRPARAARARPSRSSVSRRRGEVDDRPACGPSRRRRARRAAPSRSCPLGSAGRRTRCTAQASRRRASGSTMLVVASGVCASQRRRPRGRSATAAHARRRRGAPRPRSSRPGGASGTAPIGTRPRRRGKCAACRRRRGSVRRRRRASASAATAGAPRGESGGVSSDARRRGDERCAATAPSSATRPRAAHPVNFGLRRLRVLQRRSGCRRRSRACCASSAARRTRRRPGRDPGQAPDPGRVARLDGVDRQRRDEVAARLWISGAWRLVGGDREILERDRGLAEALGVLGRAAEVEARALDGLRAEHLAQRRRRARARARRRRCACSASAPGQRCRSARPRCRRSPGRTRASARS